MISRATGVAGVRAHTAPQPDLPDISLESLREDAEQLLRRLVRPDEGLDPELWGDWSDAFTYTFDPAAAEEVEHGE